MVQPRSRPAKWATRQDDGKGPVVFRVAAHLSERHSVKLGTRSLDILHIASAKAIRAAEVLSFDVRQRSLAQLVGLVVAP